MSIPSKVAIALIILASLLSEKAAAEEPTYLAWIRVSDLIRKCSGTKVWEAAYCMGYVVGVADVANNDPTSLKICIPQPVTQAQMKAVVVQYFTRHPDDAAYAAFSSVRAALRERYPCPATELQ